MRRIDLHMAYIARAIGVLLIDGGLPEPGFDVTDGSENIPIDLIAVCGRIPARLGERHTTREKNDQCIKYAHRK